VKDEKLDSRKESSIDNDGYDNSERVTPRVAESVQFGSASLDSFSGLTPNLFKLVSSKNRYKLHS